MTAQQCLNTPNKERYLNILKMDILIIIFLFHEALIDTEQAKQYANCA